MHTNVTSHNSTCCQQPALTANNHHNEWLVFLCVFTSTHFESVSTVFIHSVALPEWKASALSRNPSKVQVMRFGIQANRYTYLTEFSARAYAHCKSHRARSWREVWMKDQAINENDRLLPSKVLCEQHYVRFLCGSAISFTHDPCIMIFQLHKEWLICCSADKYFWSGYWKLVIASVHGLLFKLMSFHAISTSKTSNMFYRLCVHSLLLSMLEWHSRCHGLLLRNLKHVLHQAKTIFFFSSRLVALITLIGLWRFIFQKFGYNLLYFYHYNNILHFSSMFNTNCNSFLFNLRFLSWWRTQKMNHFYCHVARWWMDKIIISSRYYNI